MFNRFSKFLCYRSWKKVCAHQLPLVAAAVYAFEGAITIVAAKHRISQVVVHCR